MPLKKLQARTPPGSEKVVESLVEKARSQAGSERILVVYQQDSACIYFEPERAQLLSTRRES